MSEEAPVQEITAPATPEKKKPFGRVIIVAIVVVALFFGVKNWLYGRNHETTDNAQVAGDVVLIAPLVQGTVTDILVADNAVVKKGQTLVKLDPSKLTTAYNQAQANLKAAIADANAAGVSVTFAQATARADEATASGAVSEAGADIGAAQAVAQAAKASIKGSEAQAQAAVTEVEAAKVDLQVAKEALARVTTGIGAAEAEWEWSKSAVHQAESSLASVVATHEQAAQTLHRTRALYEEGAESKQALENAIAEEATSAQAVEAAKSNVSMAGSTVKVKESAVKAARAQADETRALVDQANSRIKSAVQRASAARAGVDVARMQASAGIARVGSASAHRTTVEGQAQGARATQINVAKLQADQRQALARVDQASAALKAAEIDLGHAVITAPCDGRVSKRAIEVGSFVQVGTAMLYVVPSDSIFVLANFKETQVSRMRQGEKVDIELDSLPGHPYHGEVESIAAATGSTFALLPPDNATGNFVKVVQRVPVKIRIDSAEAGDSRLRVGMSAVVSVELK